MGTSLHPHISVAVRIILLFLLAIAPLRANPIQENTREECQQLIDQAWEEEGNKDYAAALELLFKAELMAEENQWGDKLGYIKNQIGTIYTHISNFGEAMEYYQESFAIAQKNKDLREKSSVPLSNIGRLYLKEKKYDEALYYYNQAYDIAKTTANGAKKNIAMNIASIYNRLDEPEKSLKILREVEKPTGNFKVDFIWKGIYIEALLKNGQKDLAKDLAEELYTELSDGIYDDFRDECYTCITTVLSQIYEQLDKKDLAITYAKKGLKSSDEFSGRMELYEHLSNLYLKKNDFETALHYKDSVVLAKDSLSASINRNLYEANKVKFRTREYQNELKSEKERQKRQRTLFIAVVFLVLVVSFSVYRGLRNKVIRQKLLAEKQSEITKLKQQQLKHEIAEKNRKLSAKALYLSNRNELIQEIINSLESNNKKIGNKEITQQIKIIKNFLKTDEHQEDFIKHFESVNPEFLRRLKENHKRLSANDIRFLCYIFMNLSLKEISIILNITYNACQKRSRHIKEKMKLGKQTSLYDYVLKVGG